MKSEYKATFVFLYKELAKRGNDTGFEGFRNEVERLERLATERKGVIK